MKIVLCFILSFFMMTSIAFAVNDVVIYSNDAFTNDSGHASDIQSSIILYGRSAITVSRPTVIYGLNQHIQNGNLIFISCHGKSYGGHLILTNVNSATETLYSTNNVPNSLNNRLVFLSACYSAKNIYDTPLNLCSKFVNNGASVVLGYDFAVDYIRSRYLEVKFFNHLCSYNHTVGESYALSKIYTQSRYGSSCIEASSFKYFGNASLSL